jgi:rubrerythrin
MEKRFGEFKNIFEALEAAITREVDAYNYYSKAAEEAGNIALKELFLSLAAREKEHEWELKERLSNLKVQMEIDRAMTGGCW